MAIENDTPQESENIKEGKELLAELYPLVPELPIDSSSEPQTSYWQDCSGEKTDLKSEI